jgi:hypothetical protein
MAAEPAGGYCTVWRPRHPEKPVGEIALIAKIIRGSPKLPGARCIRYAAIFDIDAEDTAAALQYCAGCGVRQRCRDWALRCGDVDGVCGGLIFVGGTAFEPHEWLEI